MSLDVYLYEKSEVFRTPLVDLAREQRIDPDLVKGDLYLHLDADDQAVVILNQQEVYWRNITHNLASMADAAGIYEHLWRPDEIGVTRAEQLIEPLSAGLSLLESDRKRFEAYNPENGWGDYDGLVSFVMSYLVACRENPTAIIYASR